MSIIERESTTLAEKRKTPYIFEVKQLSEQKKYFNDYIKQLEDDNKEIEKLEQSLDDVKQRNIKLAYRLQELEKLNRERNQKIIELERENKKYSKAIGYLNRKFSCPHLKRNINLSNCNDACKNNLCVNTYDCTKRIQIIKETFNIE